MHAFKRKKRTARSSTKPQRPARTLISAGMRLTFRAEVMPGRESDERTYTVACVLANGRVELKGLLGQHAETEFESAS